MLVVVVASYYSLVLWKWDILSCDFLGITYYLLAYWKFRGFTVVIIIPCTVKALNSFTIKSMAVLEFRKALENTELSIQLCWIPGNKTANELARLCSISNAIEVVNSVRTPLWHFFQVIYMHYSERFQQKWLDEKDVMSQRKYGPYSLRREQNR